MARARERERTGSNGSAPAAVEAPPGVPDVLGDEGRIETVANMLGQVQAQLFQLRVEVAANGLDDEDEIGPKPGGSRDEAETVAEKRERLAASEKRITDEFADLMPRVERVLERNKGR